jgi:hypothetical protein
MKTLNFENASILSLTFYREAAKRIISFQYLKAVAIMRRVTVSFNIRYSAFFPESVFMMVELLSE